ncbi:hypothetical protein CK203_095351 [Vitis vinifera]|uniref:Uncharacterized protein n=1 Tax=Vitis vinifera TaxID=29760 RepID=A0A438E733_VITVI|nr:hypothetical protein CK203_095351 [Vitis vinifera]
MIDRLKEQDKIDMVLWNLQSSVEEAIDRGLRIDTTPSPNSKGKKPVGSFSRFGETSMRPRPPHPRAITPPPPRPYVQRPVRQFTQLGMTLIRAFEKLKNTGLIGHDIERCVTLHHAVQDLIDSGLVNLSGPSVTTNPLPTHSTYVVSPPPSLQ